MVVSPAHELTAITNVTHVEVGFGCLLHRYVAEPCHIVVRLFAVVRERLGVIVLVSGGVSAQRRGLFLEEFPERGYITGVGRKFRYHTGIDIQALEDVVDDGSS